MPLPVEDMAYRALFSTIGVETSLHNVDAGSANSDETTVARHYARYFVQEPLHFLVRQRCEESGLGAGSGHQSVMELKKSREGGRQTAETRVARTNRQREGDAARTSDIVSLRMEEIASRTS